MCDIDAKVSSWAQGEVSPGQTEAPGIPRLDWRGHMIDPQLDVHEHRWHCLGPDPFQMD